jgi:transcriptional regulator with XRE-family HTH domain
MNDIEHLRRIKKSRRLSYDKMAAEMGVVPRTLYRWLKKENAPSPMAQSLIGEYIERNIAAVEGR